MEVKTSDFTHKGGVYRAANENKCKNMKTPVGFTGVFSNKRLGCMELHTEGLAHVGGGFPKA